MSNNSDIAASSPVEQSQVLVEYIVRSLPVGVVAYDGDLKVIHINSIAADILGTDDYLHKPLAAGTKENVWGGWESSLKAVISSSQEASFDSVEFSHPKGPKILKIRCSPLHGDMPAAVAVIEDITGMDKAGRDLSHSERLAAMGKIAGKVAHELNNPMDGILRYISMSQRAIEQGHLDKPKEYLSKSREGLLRMVGIISQMLEFSRGKYLHFEYATLDRIVEESVKTMRPKSGNVSIIINSNESIDRQYRADNLYQVFSNLIKNAVDAMDGEGHLVITISKQNQELAVEFKDDGPGFRPEYTQSLFEPFFTTKENGKGTGLGLAICKDIIENYNGRITAENNGDKGCRFTVYLPLESKC